MELLNLGVFLAVLGLAGQVFAQSPVAAATRQSELQALAASLRQRDTNDRRVASAYARRAGIPLRRELPNGGVLELQRIAPGSGPIFYLTNNIVAAATVSTDAVWPAGSAGLSLDGAGMTIAEWDGGAIFSGHPDLIGRVTQVDGVTGISEHSTHVAGTLIGSGDLLIDSRGMAYSAHLAGQASVMLRFRYDSHGEPQGNLWQIDDVELEVFAAAGPAGPGRQPEPGRRRFGAWSEHRARMDRGIPNGLARCLLRHDQPARRWRVPWQPDGHGL